MMRSLALLVLASLTCAAAIAKEPLTSQSSPDEMVPEANSPETELVAELEVTEHVVPGASILVPPANASTGRTFSHSKAAIQTGRGNAVQRLTRTIWTPASEGDWHKLLTSTHKSLTAETKVKLVWRKQKAEKEISKKKKAAELALKKRVAAKAAAKAAAKKEAAAKKAKKAARKEHHAKLKEKGIKTMNQVLEGSTKTEVQRKASRKAEKKHQEKRDKTYTAESKKKREAAYKSGVEAAKKAAKKHTAAEATRKAELKRKALKAHKELQEKEQAKKNKTSKHKKAEAHQKKKERASKKAEAEGHSKHKAAAELKKKAKEHATKAAGQATAKEIAEKKLSQHQHHHHPHKQSDEVYYKIGRQYFLKDKKKKMKHGRRSAKQIAAAEKAWHAESKHIWQMKLGNKIAVATNELEGMAQA